MLTRPPSPLTERGLPISIGLLFALLIGCGEPCCPDSDAGPSLDAPCCSSTDASTDASIDASCCEEPGPAGALSFALSNVSVEAGDMVEIEVERVGGTDGEVSVEVASLELDARSDLDYRRVSERLSWGDGDASPRSVVLQTHQRGGAGRELSLVLRDPSGGATLADPNTLRVALTATATLVVASDGSGDFRTIAEAMDAASPGDVIEIRASTPGGSEDYVESLVLPSSGAEGREITVMARPGDSIRVYSRNGRTIQDDSAQAYWVFAGFRLGDADTSWTQESAGKSVTSRLNIELDDESHHITFRDMIIHGGSSYVANLITGGCHHIGVIDCEVDLAGTNHDTREGHPNFGLDRADLLVIENAHSVYIAHSTFIHGGHNNFDFEGVRSYIEDNHFDGDWSDRDTGFGGQRALSIHPAYRAPPPYGSIVFQRNIMRNAGASSDNPVNPISPFIGARMIVRDNYFLDSTQAIRQTLMRSQTGPIANNRFYHNTFYNLDFVYYISSNGRDWPGNFVEQRFMNNIGAAMRNEDTRYQFVLVPDPTPLDGYSDHWKGSFFDGNSIHRVSGDPSEILFRGVGSVSGALNFREAAAQWPEVWGTQNDDAEQTFVDPMLRTSTDYDEVAHGLTLRAGSPAIGAALPLTFTRGSYDGSSATLRDGFTFSDGMDLAYFGIGGDYIAIGDNPVRRIVSLDRVTGELTLDGPVSGADGDPVRHVLDDGVTVASNRGASQTR